MSSRRARIGAAIETALNASFAATGPAEVVDSFPSATGNAVPLSSGQDLYSQSFVPVNHASPRSIKFWLAREGVPTGPITAVLYRASGTHGVNAVPSTPVGIAAQIDASLITVDYNAVDWQEVVFTLPAGLIVEAGETYAVVIEYVWHTATDFLRMSTEPPAHGGNAAANGVPTLAHDICFEVAGLRAHAKPTDFIAHRQVHVVQEKDRHPSGVVFDGGTNESRDRGGDLVEMVDEFAVVLRVLGQRDVAPDDSIDPLYLWTVRALMADITLDGECQMLKMSAREPTEATEGDRIYVSTVQRMLITYQTRRNDPEATQ